MMRHIYAAVRDGILNSRGLALISIRIPTFIVRAGLKGRKLAADANASSSIKRTVPRSINIFNRQHRSSTADLHFLQPLVRELFLSREDSLFWFHRLASCSLRFYFQFQPSIVIGDGGEWRKWTAPPYPSTQRKRRNFLSLRNNTSSRVSTSQM